MPARQGVTLAELLVVLAILGVLASLLLPIISSARNSATRTACMNNLRQVGMCFEAYANEHHRKYPAEGNKGERNPTQSDAWFYRLPEYADGVTLHARNSIFQCAGFEAHTPDVFDNSSPKSFKMNGYIDKKKDKTWRYRQGQSRFESRTMLMTDCVAGETGMGQWGHAAKTAVDDSRHPGGVNVLFLDGHTLNVTDTPPEDDSGKIDWSKSFQWDPLWR